LLALQDFSCERDNRLLFAGLNVAFAAGDVWHIEGPNGIGKTSLLRQITGVSREFGGRMLWRDRPIQQCRYDFARSLLYVGHLPAVKKSLTALENLRSYCPAAAGDQLDAALAAMGLYGFERVPCFRLSAGQLRRVALARLVLSDAPLWVLDEPFTALDSLAVTALEQRIAAHAQAGGCVIMTTHQAPRLSVQSLSLGAYAVLE
jgi:heme exporter protein A